MLKSFVYGKENSLMSNPKRPVNVHEAYHAHVYFDESTLAFATQLCEKAGDIFSLKVGRIHQRPVGPHTMWSCQIIFFNTDFDQFISWLDQNRGDLTVLVHGNTGDAKADHTSYAYWLGDEVALDLRGF